MKKRALEKALCTVAVISLAVCYWSKATGTEVVEEGIYYNIRDEPEEIKGEPIPVDVVPETTDRSFDYEKFLLRKGYISLGTFEVTAYSLAEGSGCGLTKSGTIPQLNYTIAVDPEVIPLGSILVVDGVEYVAEDVGALVKGRVAGIYVESTEIALNYGRQIHEVYIKRNTP